MDIAGGAIEFVAVLKTPIATGSQMLRGAALAGPGLR